MSKYTDAQLDLALQVISSTIINCQKMQPKFKVGSSQHTLLKNRIQALQISELLMLNKTVEGVYSNEDLKNALAPIESIIHKCKKGQANASKNSPTYKRLDKMIQAMEIARERLLKKM